MCPLCVRPLRINRNSKDFIVHFNQLHPNDAMPYDFITKKVITNGQATSMIVNKFFIFLATNFIMIFL